jgi:hypothetical protein
MSQILGGAGGSVLFVEKGINDLSAFSEFEAPDDALEVGLGLLTLLQQAASLCNRRPWPERSLSQSFSKPPRRPWSAFALASAGADWRSSVDLGVQFSPSARRWATSDSLAASACSLIWARLSALAATLMKGFLTRFGRSISLSHSNSGVPAWRRPLLACPANRHVEPLGE